jgi:hypothetical protein
MNAFRTETGVHLFAPWTGGTYGMTDMFVPPSHGEWLAANVPGCIVKINAAAGHLGANQEQEIAENARWLSAGIAPDGSRTHSPVAD